MNSTTIDLDIQVMCVTATSFPSGVMGAYTKLRSLVANPDSRRYFGISHPDASGTITYKAATEILDGDDPQKLGLEAFTIKAGAFAYIDIQDHMSKPTSIGDAFKELLVLPELDPQGYCLEIYKNWADKDVRCLVPLKK